MSRRTNALVPCRTCGVPIRRTASRCPICGSHDTPQRVASGLAAVVLVLGLVLAFLIGP